MTDPLEYEYVIIGSGFYGMHAAHFLAKNGVKVAVIECDAHVFSRASSINQARVHFGYHYPRSIATAQKTQIYFDKFCEQYGFALQDQFDKIYAIAHNFSYTSAMQFEKFCQHANIPCEEINVPAYFKEIRVEKAYKTKEYSYDAGILSSYLKEELDSLKTDFYFKDHVTDVQKDDEAFILTLNSGRHIKTGRVLNATFASVNHLNRLFGAALEPIKYELCEVILVKPGDVLKDIGLTVMDGPFFSIMPFGKTGLHSLTSVSYTPHKTSFNEFPTFDCQKRNTKCTSTYLDNCNGCAARPETAWPRMNQLSRSYLNDNIAYTYEKSLYSIKPILVDAEIDDRRPTLIREHSKKPLYRCVFSGKINTVYDLEQELNDDIAS